MKIKKIGYIALGCIGVGLGAVGAVLPLLPAFPFLLLAAFCFARSSERLDRWFKGTKLYKENLESFVQGKGMTKKTTVRIMVTVTLLMSIGTLCRWGGLCWDACGCSISCIFALGSRQSRQMADESISN